MGKLFNLKAWLTVADAAQHLSIVFDEDVTEADVLRLALDGRLRLSVCFVNRASAKFGKIVPVTRSNALLVCPENDSERRAMHSALNEMMNIIAGEAGEYVRFTQRMKIGDGECLKLEHNIVDIDGVWDLPMIGAERLDVEHEFQKLTLGPDVTLHCGDGAFVERDGKLYQLQAYLADNERFDKENLRKPWDHPRNYHAAQGLPDDSVLVVRTDSLREFERAISTPPATAGQTITPNGRAHVSDKLAKMNQAAAKFWGNADRADRGTHPDNATVAAWLVKQDFSSTLAGKAATIIRPEWAPTGRKPEE